MPLAQYAGRYRSSLYGDLQIDQTGEALSVRIGRFTAELSHWENDVFYAKTPTRLNYDWLVQFDARDSGVTAVTLKTVGWHEPDAVFPRATEQR